jgi:hypothetical protein
MSVSTMQQNVIYGIGEGALVASTGMLAYALRWMNAAYRDVIGRPHFTMPQKRSVFRTAAGLQTYQLPPSCFGFMSLKDMRNDEPIEQVTPEEFDRRSSSTFITAESFTADVGVDVSLANTAIHQYTERVYDSDGVYYARDTDYTIAYATGEINATTLDDDGAYLIEYAHYESSDPQRFCLEYDAENNLYVIRFDPVPDAVSSISLIYMSAPAIMSASEGVLWSQMEYALERGGIYFGSMEMTEDKEKRKEFKVLYEQAIAALLQVSRNMVPKRARIQLALRKTDYLNGTTRGDLH